MSKFVLWISCFILFISSAGHVHPQPAENILPPVSAENSEVEELVELGMELLYTDPDQSQTYLRRAEFLAEASNDRQLIVLACQNISIYYWARGDFQKALEYDRKTLSLYQSLQDPNGIGYALNSLAVSLTDLGLNHEALKNLLEAENIFKSEGDSIALQMVYINLGVVFDSMRDNDAALRFYRKALALGLRLELYSEVGDVYNNMAEIRMKQQRYNDAYDFYSKAYKIYDQQNDIAGIALVKGNLAEYYCQTENYEIAEKLFNEALEGFLNMADRNGECEIKLGLGKVYRLTKRFTDSEEMLNATMEMASEHHYLELYIRAQYQLALLMYEKKEYDLAYLHFVKYDAAKDSLYRESSNTDFDNLRMVYEAEEKERRLEALQAQNEKEQIINIQKDRLRNALLAIVILMFLFLVTGLMLYSRLKSTNAKLRRHQNKLKVANAQLLNEKKLAEISSEAKAEFVSVLSHEIRTPLNAIIGISYALQEENDIHEQQEYLEALIHSAKTLLGFTTNILDLSRLDAGKIELSVEKIQLRKLIHQIIRTFEPELKKKDLEINTHFESTIPETIEGDKLRLTQILLNLISNSVKYTREGKINISVDCISREGDDVWLKIRVQDTGIGISEELHPQIFDRYSRLQHESRLTPQSSGLGLSITKSLIELLGGTIEFESQPGVGSLFTVLLKYKVSKTNGARLPDPAKEKTGLNGYQLDGKSLLLVEDNEVNVMFTLRLLSKLKTTVEVARDGEEAVELSRSKNFDLILMDLQMPKMNGIDAAEIILRENPEARIIALTANTDHQIKLKLMNAGFRDLLIKPFNPHELGEKISHWIYS